MGKGPWTLTDTVFLSTFVTLALVAIYSPEISLAIASVTLVATNPG